MSNTTRILLEEARDSLLALMLANANATNMKPTLWQLKAEQKARAALNKIEARLSKNHHHPR